MTTSSSTTVTGTISGVSGVAAIGTNIRQNPIFLKVEIAAGDPAALDRIGEMIRLDAIPERVTASGRDFPNLVGRDGVVSTALEALEGRRSVATFGVDGIGKSVFLRHLARRADSHFSRGVALIPSGGMLWQDIGNEIVKAFFNAGLPIYLGPTQLRAVLRDLDALILLDDVDAGAKVNQLFAQMESASFVVAAPARMLAGESQAIRLDSLDPAGVEALIRQTLVDLGEPTDVDPGAASQIGLALSGHPGRIIRTVEEAHGRGIDLTGLAAELQVGVLAATSKSLGGLSPVDRAVVSAVAALGGAPAGPEHIAAVVSTATDDDVEGLVQRRVLRVASPALRLDADVAAVISDDSDPDETRTRFMDHFIDWAVGDQVSAVDIAAESRAIVALLEWAERTGRVKAAHALAQATESGFALAGRWATWAQVTGYRLRAAETLGLSEDAAIALNQMGIQALAEDSAPRARAAFLRAQQLALRANAPDVAQIAARNIEIIDGPIVPPKNGTDPPPSIVRPLFLAGLVVVAALMALFVLNRPAIAIEPAARVFEPAAVDSDGEQVTFTVSNRGLTTLEALAVGLSGDAAGEFYIVSGDCPGSSLPAGQSCSVVLLFHPTRAGDGRATLTISSRDGTVASASIESHAAEASANASPSAPPPSPSAPPPSITPSPQVDALPDLAIRRFAPTGIPTLGDFLLVPVEVVIVNAGDDVADLFPIVITADREPVPFEVEGEDPLGLLTRAPLGPKESVSYSGMVRLDRETPLDLVRLVVEADSCAREPNAPPECRVVEPSDENNSLRLEAVDLQVANVQLGVPREPPGIWIVQPSWADVDVAFEILNTGIEPAADFWIAAFLGQIRADLHSDTVEYDQVRTMLHVPGLEAGGRLPVAGVAMVPRTSLNSEMQVVIGCPPLSEPCFVPEIAYDNNWTSVAIPPQPTPIPTPTPVPNQID